jgi:hypothetical protein
VAGAAALLLAEGVKTTDVESVLYSTATRTGSGRTESMGNGIVNAQAALQAVGVSIRIVWPTPDFPVETATVPVLTRLRNANMSSLRVTIDGTQASGGASTQSSPGTVDVVHHASMPAGGHIVAATAASSLTGRTRRVEASFQITPRILPPGFYMFSVPYTLPSSGSAPGTVFSGHPFRMARYAPEIQQYALFESSGGLADARASFNPPSTGLARNPAGLGYWLRVLEPTRLTLNGDPVLDAEYRVPVSRGWAMIGDPFVFPVALGAAHVEAGGSALTMAQAVAAGWIRPVVYRFNGSDGYHTEATTDARLNPWESLWVQVNRDVVIVLPGVQ